MNTRSQRIKNRVSGYWGIALVSLLMGCSSQAWAQNITNDTLNINVGSGGVAETISFNGGASSWAFHNSFYGGKSQSSGALCLSSSDSTNGQDLLFSTFNGPAGYALTLKANGNVGVGTTTPQAKLDVAGTANVSVPNNTPAYSMSFGTTTKTTWQLSNSFYGSASTGALVIGTSDATTGQDLLISTFNGPSGYAMVLKANGNVGIGTAAPQSKLAVNGTITTRELVVTLLNWSDNVFADNYLLPSLAKVEQEIKANKHLPGIPSEKELVSTGLAVGDMQRLHMAKIEELTLYVIQADKQIASLTERATERDHENKRLRDQNATLADRLTALEARVTAMAQKQSVAAP